MQNEYAAWEALEHMCHTSKREWGKTIYTIEDFRFPEYEGKQIETVLLHGKTEVRWLRPYDDFQTGI